MKIVDLSTPNGSILWMQSQQLGSTDMYGEWKPAISEIQNPLARVCENCVLISVPDIACITDWIKGVSYYYSAEELNEPNRKI